MTDQELLKAILSMDADRQFREELRESIEAELDKPEAEQDRAKLADMTEAFFMVNRDLEAHDRMEQAQTQIRKRLRQRRLRTRLAAVCSLAVILLAANALTMHVMGVNLFAAGYVKLRGGSVVMLSSEPEDAERPQLRYVPEGFREIDADPPMDYCRFWQCYASGHKVISFSAVEAAEDKSEIRFVVPGVTGRNSRQQTVSGHAVTVMKEGEFFHAVFREGAMVYHLTTEHLDFDESQCVLESVLQAGITDP